MQAVVDAAADHLPATQLMHKAPAPSVYWPATHAVQSVSLFPSVLPLPAVDSRPAEHAMQAVAFTSDHSPASQLAHGKPKSAPDAANVPAVHSLHIVVSVSTSSPPFDASDDRPTEQLMHTAASAFFDHFPFAQASHVVTPVVTALNVPFAQSLQLSATNVVCPAARPYLPATHATPLHPFVTPAAASTAPFTSEYRPTAHLVHAAALAPD